MTKLLDTLTLPEGLRTLSREELKQIAHELRDELIDSVASSGGHFASSLGCTEISVALHHLFDTPHDKLIWDVGHQGYIHKMLTGRRDRLATIRQLGGVSGFLKRAESKFDAFGAGHAGTSISAAVGMRVALDRLDPERYVVAVIGDGSLTAGMAFEALNHAGDLGLKRLIVVLNDNEMSISPNVGALSWLFSRAVTSKTSTYARSGFKNLYRKGYVPEFFYKAIDRAEEAAQGFFAGPGPATLFESFGFRYIGPIDGHNLDELVTALDHAKAQDVPVIIHARTIKGKGYEPAEGDPVKWHGVNPFDREKGEFFSKAATPKKVPPAYTTVFSDTLIDLASKDSTIAAITAAMPTGTGLDKFAEKHPDKFFDVGICEQHAVTFAAGLACEGIRPVCAIYSTFLQRAYDQVIHDVCIQDLPVFFAMDRGGVVGNDGETHQGVFDIAYLRTIPKMVIMSPKDENEFRHMLYTGTKFNGPIAVRYPRGNGIGVDYDPEYQELPIGKGEILVSGEDAVIVAFGPIVQYALQAAAELKKAGITTTVINARFAKPLDEDLLRAELPKYKIIATLEDHALDGGFGSAVLELAHDARLELQTEIRRFGVSNAFVPHGSQAEQHALYGYDAKSIIAYVREQALAKGLETPLLAVVG